MTFEANEIEIFDVKQRINLEPEPPQKPQLAGMENNGLKGQRLDCVYDDEHLDPIALTKRMQPLDPL